MSIDPSQFQDVFFEESVEHLQTMEDMLLNLSVDDPDAEDLNTIFRAAHSIKGGSGIFGFDALTGLTHVMENILDRARKHELSLTTDIVDILLATCDILSNILDAYQNNNSINWSAIDHGIEALEAILTPDAKSNDEQGFGFFQGAPGTSPAEADDAFGFFDDAPGAPVASDNDGFGFFDDAPGAPIASDDNGFGFFDDAPGTPITDSGKASLEDEGFGFFADEPTPDAVQPATAKPAPKTPIANKSASPSTVETPAANANKRGETGSVRVDTAKIDSVMNLVGELVITQSMLRMTGRDVLGETGEKLDGALNELSRNIREIQEAVMSMRMLPVSFVFNRFPRLVRDLAKKLDKEIELVIEGGNTEIDKGMIEKLADPLTHLVRNSLDHGIEDAARRKQAGKPTCGTIILRAKQLGSNIIISIHDDGGGLNREKILAKAESNGLAIHENMPDADVWKLIFEPGFSTADQVTDVSGRGVGMDVVRRNIEAINGSIEIESTAGVGSIFSIRLPLTLAIVDGMCVKASTQVFVVPLMNIVESIQPTAKQLKSLGNDDLLFVRDQYWPIINLRDLMEQNDEIPPSDMPVIVLIEAGKHHFGLLVDELVGQQQVVIKSLEQHYRRVEGVAGATIMGDGSVALILDIESIANTAVSSNVEMQNVG